MGFEGEILREILHNKGKRLKNKKEDLDVLPLMKLILYALII